MYLYVDMKSRKEIEDNWERVVSAFVSLAGDLHEEKKRTKGELKTKELSTAMPQATTYRSP